MNFSNFRITFAIDRESFAKINYRPFLAGMIAVLILKIFTLLGFEPAKLLSPVPSKIEKFDSLRPKLEQKTNDFKVKKVSSLIPAVQAASEYDQASAYAVIDLDTGEVIAEKDIDTKTSIASITKVMTAVTALDLATPDELFEVSEEASRIIPTKIGVRPGQKLTLNELLHATLLTSANDAAGVIQEGIDKKYGEPVFIKAMNEKAKIIGMNNSHFTNPQGFDNPEHYSTVYDLALLEHYALNEYPLIRDIVKKDYYFIAANEYHTQFDLYNWNGLIGVYPNAYGVKIGNTGRAGKTTMVAAEREGKNIGVVLLGAPTTIDRDMWAAELLDVGFEKALTLKPVAITKEQLQEKYSTWKYFN